MIKIEDKQVNKIMINGKEVLKVVLNGATKYQKQTGPQWDCPFSGNTQVSTYTGTTWNTISSEQNTLYCFVLGGKGTTSSNSALRIYSSGSWTYFGDAYIAIWNPITGYLHFPYNGTIYVYSNVTGIRVRGGSGSSSTTKMIRVDLTNMNGNITTIGGANVVQTSVVNVACNTAGLLQQSKLILALANTNSSVILNTDSNQQPFTIYNNGYIDMLYAQPFQADSNRVQIGLRQADSATGTNIRSEIQTLLKEQIPTYANTMFTIQASSIFGIGDLMVVQID